MVKEFSVIRELPALSDDALLMINSYDVSSTMKRAILISKRRTQTAVIYGHYARTISDYFDAYTNSATPPRL